MEYFSLKKKEKMEVESDKEIEILWKCLYCLYYMGNHHNESKPVSLSMEDKVPFNGTAKLNCP